MWLRIETQLAPLAFVGSLLSCGTTERQQPVRDATPDLGEAPAGDVCGECAGQLMTAFTDVIGSSDPTVEDMTRFVHPEDEWIVASQELDEEEYLAHINGDESTTLSLYGNRIQDALGPGADLTRYNARMEGPMCEVTLGSTGVILTISNRPRCLVTRIQVRGNNLLD